MAIPVGARIGGYEIVAAIGAGGMGEVYRARDPRLGRDVAIKVLPDHVAGDPERVARFQREAQLLASLNHPHIGAIYGVEESDGIQALVLELVEGETLAERLGRSEDRPLPKPDGSDTGRGRPAGRPMPLDEILPIARQIAEALEAAHSQGAIHRDLKPANVKITPDGRVKILDFGLAKMLHGDPAATSMTMSPTLSVQATLGGMILGTAAYMSPEQARGKPVDRRTDIWAFGCVLFEMLTGKQAFAAGETVSDAVASILKAEPEWNALPDATPAAVRRLLRRCLTKDPRERLPDIGDARLEIRDAQSEATDVVASPPPARRDRLAWSVAAVLALLALALASLMLWSSRQTPVSLPVYRSVILPPPIAVDSRTSVPRFVRGLALSPDGRRLAFVAPGPDGRAMLWAQALDGLAAQLLGGTEGASNPFWSPDGRQLAFVAQGKLKRIDGSGGSPVTLHDGARFATGTWNRDNAILFAGEADGGILRISAAGGAASPVTSLDPAKGETWHWRPFFLPDGRRFLYRATKGTEASGVLYAGSLDSKERTELYADVLGHAYANGFLLFVRETTLMAHRFDADRLAVTGDAMPVLEHVRIGGGALLNGAFSVSESGVLVYQDAGVQRSQLVWFDRRGKEVAVLGEPAELSFVQLSPDGRQASVTVQEPMSSSRDVWLYDTARGGRTRLTSDPADEFSAVWSPDGERLAFSARRRRGDDGTNVYELTLSRKTEERLVAIPGALTSPMSWSSDGRFLLAQTPGPNSDILILPLFGDRKPVPFAATRFIEAWPEFSPDGRWIAYTSNETGRTEVYVAPFQRTGRTVPISTGGGSSPRWRRDGKEIFYLAGNESLVAVAVRGGESTIEIGDSTPLFQTRFGNTPVPYAVPQTGSAFSSTGPWKRPPTRRSRSSSTGRRR